MGPLIAHGSAVAVLIIVSYFAGCARGIEDAGRRWLAVLNRTELGWRCAYYNLNEAHGSLERSLITLVETTKAKVADLQARLDETAIPRERN
jgi:hypothetical protein